MFLIGCGEVPPTNEQESHAGAKLVSFEADLPVCDRTNAGDLVYVRDTKSFFVCEFNMWSVIDLKGEKGEDGKDANDMPLIKSMFICGSGDKNLAKFEGGEVRGLSAEVVEFSDGSFHISCGSVTKLNEYFDLEYDRQSSFALGNSIAVGLGELMCVTYGVSSYYDIAAATVTYRNNSFAELEEEKKCKRIR